MKQQINVKRTPTAIIAQKAILLSPDISTTNDSCIRKFLLNSQFRKVLQSFRVQTKSTLTKVCQIWYSHKAKYLSIIIIIIITEPAGPLCHSSTMAASDGTSPEFCR